MQKIAGSMSVGHLAPKHTLGLDGVREQARNVSPELTKDNVILRDELKGKSIEDYTNERFQPVIDEYNKKQKRNDRKIKTPYVEWHKNNGNLSQGKVSLAYECVIQIGEHESLGGQYYAAEGKQRERIHGWFEKQYSGLLDDFEKRFPHLHVLYAALHFDEKDGTPHMHLCFQPEAESSRGLSRQVSIGKALGQDGIERFESRLEAEKEGFQMGRMYKEFRHDFINKRILDMGWDLKEEIQGRKHDDKSYFKDMMTELDQKAEAREAKLDEREKNIAATEKKVKEGEQLATDKMKEAAMKVMAAKEEAAAARQETVAAIKETAAAQKEKEGLTQEIQLKQGKVHELDKKIQNKEGVAKIADEINTIYAGPGPHLKYPEVTKSKKGFGKSAQNMVTLPEDEFNSLYNKADLSEKLRMQSKEMERLADETIKAANKDEAIQELQEENLNLRQQNRSLQVQARQAQEKQRAAERERDSALGYIERQGMSPGYEHERLKEEREEHHHHIHH